MRSIVRSGVGTGLKAGSGIGSGIGSGLPLRLVVWSGSTPASGAGSGWIGGSVQV